MQNNDTPRRRAAQERDFLDAARLSGKAISLDLLLPLEWPLPPGRYSEVMSFDLMYNPTAAQRRADSRLVSRNPGLLWTPGESEAAKYGAPWPEDDAPLRAHVGRYLLHIRGKWSVHVWGERHKALPFTAFLAGYVGNRLNIGECYWSDKPAAQLLRRATSQTRFLATKGRRK